TTTGSLGIGTTASSVLNNGVGNNNNNNNGTGGVNIHSPQSPTVLSDKVAQTKKEIAAQKAAAIAAGIIPPPPPYHSVKNQDLPQYKKKIFKTIEDMNDPNGSAPKAILDLVQK